MTAEVDRWKGEAKTAFVRRDALKGELDSLRTTHEGVVARLGEIEPKVKTAGDELTAAQATLAQAQETLATRDAELARVQAHAELTIAFLAEGGDRTDLDMFGDIADRLLREGRVSIKEGKVEGVSVAIAGIKRDKPKLFVIPARGAPHTGVPSSSGNSGAGLGGRQIIVHPTFGTK